MAAFAAWFAAFGPGLRTSGPINLTYLLNIAGFVAWGLEASAAGVFGLPPIGAGLLPILAALVAWHWYRQGTIAGWQLGMTVGLVAWFFLVSLGRAQNGPLTAGDSQFVYVGVVLALPLVADAASEIPWQRLWQPSLVTVFAICLLGNIVQLWAIARSQTGVVATQTAELETVQEFRDAPDIALNRQIDGSIMPMLTAGRYLAAAKELGSPVPAATLQSVGQLPPGPVDRVMVNLFGGAVTVTPDFSSSTKGLACKQVDATTGSTIDIQALPGQSFLLEPSKLGEAFLFLGYRNPPSSEPLMRVQLLPGTPERVYLPNTGKTTVWQLRISTTAVGLTQVCGAASTRTYESITVYSGDAANGRLDEGWAAVPDAAALDGHAAMATHGTFPSYANDVFEAPIVPVTATYDLWYRVKVASVARTIPEMTLGLWDDQAATWVASKIYQANELGTDYEWVKVASNLTPPPGHSLHFLAFFTYRLGTDWLIDSAVLVPTTPTQPR
jgi:hypothetical protein